SGERPVALPVRSAPARHRPPPPPGADGGRTARPEGARVRRPGQAPARGTGHRFPRRTCRDAPRCSALPPIWPLGKTPPSHTTPCSDKQGPCSMADYQRLLELLVGQLHDQLLDEGVDPGLAAAVGEALRCNGLPLIGEPSLWFVEGHQHALAAGLTDP